MATFTVLIDAQHAPGRGTGPRAPSTQISSEPAGTISTSNTSLAETSRVAAPVGFLVQTFGSLTRSESRSSVGTSVKVICQRSAPTTCMSIRSKSRQLG